ncbi:MAG: site-specific integrase [Actinobacteria bacterium]|nr:site-specific integrase [Actinomycetota bacterium]
MPVTLAELVEQYLAQHDAAPVTLEKLQWLLAKAVAAFGDRRLGELRSLEIAAWRMTIPPGYRFEATQALRQVLARAVVWGMLDVNPAKQGVENPQRRRTEKRPFESWTDLEAVAERLGPRFGPMVLFAAATGLRPGEWIALEYRDIDREARVAYVRRAFSKGSLKCTKTEASVRAVPLQAIALDALERLPSGTAGELLFPALNGGYLDLHNFRNRNWRPAQGAAGIEPPRRISDLRHTFATFALRAGISTFDLSRYMGASLTMIDRHYGHLARDGREHAIRLLDTLNAPSEETILRRGGRSWTLGGRRKHHSSSIETTESPSEQEISRSPLTDSNRRPPPYHLRRDTRARAGRRGHESPASRRTLMATSDPRVDGRGRAGVPSTFPRKVSHRLAIQQGRKQV